MDINNEPDIVRIEWLDSSHVEEPCPRKLAEEQKPLKVVSYGELLAEDENLVIASSYCENETYRGILAIPRAVVIKIEVLNAKGEVQDAEEN